jgi:hypothetical protein
VSDDKPNPQIRAPNDADVSAFIEGEEADKNETSGHPDVQTSGNSDGTTDAERVQTTVYLEADTKRKLKTYCQLEGCEMSELVNRLVADELADWTPDL